MFKRTLSVLLLLLPCICHAGATRFRVFIESGLDKNYNVLLNLSQTAVWLENNDIFLLNDLAYFRFVKDDGTLRLSNSLHIFVYAMCVAQLMHKKDYTDLEVGLLNLPILLMNPTIGYQIAKPLGISAGYNFDFTIPLDGEAEDNKNKKIYFFAPKIQLEWTFARWTDIPPRKDEYSFLLIPSLSYQVFDYFSTKKGFHWKVALVVQLN